MAAHQQLASEVSDELKLRMSISLRLEWVIDCLQGLQAARPESGAWPRPRLIEAVFAQALCSDLCTAGAGSLPQAINTMHKQVLQGKYALQIEEVVNTAASAKERYTNNKGDRCLKLHLTDGQLHVFAMEYRHVPALSWDCPAGCKLLVENVMVRRGILLLQPENCVLLGGHVAELEAARLRAVECWNRPAEGRSQSAGYRDVCGEARRAAWTLPAAAAAAAQAPGAMAAGIAQAGGTLQGASANHGAIAVPGVRLAPRAASLGTTSGQQAAVVHDGMQAGMATAVAHEPGPASHGPGTYTNSFRNVEKQQQQQQQRQPAQAHIVMGEAWPQQPVQVQQADNRPVGQPHQPMTSTSQPHAVPMQQHHPQQQQQHTGWQPQNTGLHHGTAVQRSVQHDQPWQQPGQQQVAAQTTACMQPPQRCWQQPNQNAQVGQGHDALHAIWQQQDQIMPLRHVSGVMQQQQQQQQQAAHAQQQPATVGIVNGAQHNATALHHHPQHHQPLQQQQQPQPQLLPPPQQQQQQHRSTAVQQHQLQPLQQQQLWYQQAESSLHTPGQINASLRFPNGCQLEVIDVASPSPIQAAHAPQPHAHADMTQQPWGRIQPLEACENRLVPHAGHHPHAGDTCMPACPPISLCVPATAFSGVSGSAGVVAAKGYAVYSRQLGNPSAPAGLPPAQPFAKGSLADQGSAGPSTAHNTPASMAHLGQTQEAAWRAQQPSGTATAPRPPISPVVIDLLTDDDDMTDAAVALGPHAVVATQPQQQELSAHQQAGHMVVEAVGVGPGTLPRESLGVHQQGMHVHGTAANGVRTVEQEHSQAGEGRHSHIGTNNPPQLAGYALPQPQWPAGEQQHMEHGRSNMCLDNVPDDVCSRAVLMTQDMWAQAPQQHIWQLPEHVLTQQPTEVEGTGRLPCIAASNGDGDRTLVKVLGVFISCTNSMACIEDGTGLLHVDVSEQLYRKLFSGYSMSQLVELSQDPAHSQHMREVAQHAEHMFRQFHGLMLLQLPAAPVEVEMGSGGQVQGRRALLLDLKDMDSEQDWQDAAEQLLL